MELQKIGDVQEGRSEYFGVDEIQKMADSEDVCKELYREYGL